ncbi:hypothetical protein DMC64_19920 [Amycolatopsis sp. WAC 04197]|uniref:hypothetical protein n=1 Tax=Amycolatopsis sp. WAC 04197 TaxID=2203199 RepID=UPI000F768575|nr:hypothetical protein [Amycolatopsis sp. WAC 04197]RSN45116.1 hypothetical protein DMC64_19920 [Amycolatopsis sp. WAC 04197]
MIAVKRTNPTDDVMSAAHHCLAAENFFARAKELHHEIVGIPRDRNRFHRRIASRLELSYQTYLEWARFHLQMAEVITQGANLVMAYNRASSTLDPRLLSADVAHEVVCWDGFIGGQPRDGRERALPKPGAADAEY